MYPIICKLGPFTIYSYGLMVVLAFVASTFLLSRQAKQYGLNPDLIFNLSFIVLVSGITGARILYVILNLGHYFNNPVEILILSRGGLAWFGGLTSAIVSCAVYLKHKRLDVYRIFDLAIPYIALAQAIGRIGCFLNGCCFGRQSLRFGVYFPVHNAFLIPTQLYSSLALLAIFIVLRIREAGTHQKGEIFYLYLFLYSVWRLFIEFFRADSQALVFGLTIFQIFSSALFILSSVLLIKVKRQKK